MSESCLTLGVKLSVVIDFVITPGETFKRIVEWLDEHGFSYTDVWCGVGKPPAVAYVDDRAVHCDPLSGGQRPETASVTAALAFETALELCGVFARDK